MEKVIINFSESELDWDYSEMIFESVKNHLFWDRNIEYIFPQIKKWWAELKNKVWKKLIKLDIKKEFNVGFLTTKTEKAVFKIIFLD